MKETGQTEIPATAHELEQLENFSVPIRASYLSIYDASWSGYLGIVLWGGYYGVAWPLVGSFIAAVAAIFSLFGSGSADPSVLPQALVFVFVSLLVGAFVGAIVAATIGVFVMLVVTWMNKSLGNIWTPLTAAGISGGITGFIAASPVWTISLVEGSFVNIMVSLIFGPLLAMVCGQIGATLMAAANIRHHYEMQRTRVAKLWNDEVQSDLSKFGIKQALIATGWIAFLFAILSAIGRYYLPTAISLGACLFFQFPIFFLVEILWRKGVQRRLAPALLTDQEKLAILRNSNERFVLTGELEHPDGEEGKVKDPFDF